VPLAQYLLDTDTASFFLRKHFEAIAQVAPVRWVDWAEAT